MAFAVASAVQRSATKTPSYASYARRALASAALPLSASASSVPTFARRLSISLSTRETKNEATEWTVARSMPAASAFSRPARYASMTSR